MCTGRQIVALTASIFLGWVSITLYYVNFTEAPAFILERLLKDCVGIRGFRSCSYVLSFSLFFGGVKPPLLPTNNKQKQSRIATIYNNSSYYSTHGNIESLKPPQGSYYLEVQK